MEKTPEAKLLELIKRPSSSQRWGGRLRAFRENSGSSSFIVSRWIHALISFFRRPGLDLSPWQILNRILAVALVVVWAGGAWWILRDQADARRIQESTIDAESQSPNDLRAS